MISTGTRHGDEGARKARNTECKGRDGGCEPAEGCTYTVSLRGVLGIADYGFARLGRCVYVRLPLWFWSVVGYAKQYSRWAFLYICKQI